MRKPTFTETQIEWISQKLKEAKIVMKGRYRYKDAQNAIAGMDKLYAMILLDKKSEDECRAVREERGLDLNKFMPDAQERN